MATKVKKDKPVVATLEIKNCRDCPFLKQERHYTADSFETAFDWFCAKKDNKEIAGYISWNEEKDVEIPKWCPLVKTSKKSKK